MHRLYSLAFGAAAAALTFTASGASAASLPTSNGWGGSCAAAAPQQALQVSGSLLVLALHCVQPGNHAQGFVDLGESLRALMR